MNSKNVLRFLAVACFGVVCIAIGFWIANSNVSIEPIQSASADSLKTNTSNSLPGRTESREIGKQDGKYSPVKARARDFYAPNTEDLGPNEMRLIACGTGMPTARPKQAASCWVLELGNGDKFIFDIGTGSAERISALQIPYNYIDKLFISHLHTDHFGDLDALFVGGALAGRQKPLRVWGPSGDTTERGTKYALDHLRKALTWDLDGRQGLTDPRGYHLDVTEFDYRGKNQIVYQENGVPFDPGPPSILWTAR